MTSCTLSVKNVLRCFITTKTRLKGKAPQSQNTSSLSMLYFRLHLQSGTIKALNGFQAVRKYSAMQPLTIITIITAKFKIHGHIVFLSFTTLHSFHPEDELLKISLNHEVA